MAPVTTALDYGYGTDDARTVKVGAQEWLGKNLNVDHFANGDPIPEAATDEEWKRASENKQPAWCYYNNDPANGRTYGKLYNGYAVKDPRGLAPVGWHVQSDEEWTNLTRQLAPNNVIVNKKTAVNFFSTEAVGTLQKTSYGWDNNGNGTNTSGLAGLPGGYRDTNVALFHGLGAYGYWWGSSEGTTEGAWYRYLSCNLGGVYGRTTLDKGRGFSVRCLRD